MTGFRDFLPGLRRSKPRFDAPLAPEKSFVAIGDLHGCDDLLAALLEKLPGATPAMPIVFVGDYIDRGPDSAAVLRRIMQLCHAAPQSVFALKGNHETMLLEFIETPVESGPRWLYNGGDSTLQSFGVQVSTAEADELISARDRLRENVGEKMIDWMRSLPLIWQSGNVMVSHAGGDPSSPIEPRRGHGLLWGHPDFLRKERQDGLWMVHGHFIVSESGSNGGRIAIDTGAYATGCLTAAIIEPGSVRFVST